MLNQYLEWLKEAKGVEMSPDDLITHNLRAVYESSATDVKRKRTHTGWLDEYINDYLLSMASGPSGSPRRA